LLLVRDALTLALSPRRGNKAFLTFSLREKAGMRVVFSKRFPKSPPQSDNA